MRIVLTGSLGHIGKPLTELLIACGHSVTVISSSASRQPVIMSMGAKAAIGSVNDTAFLTTTFQGADMVYTMMPFNANTAAYADPHFDVEAEHLRIARNYAEAIQQSGVTNVIHLSTVGAHTPVGVGLLNPHFHVEGTLNLLPDQVRIKFMRPVGFYYNMYAFIPAIRGLRAIVQNYGGNEPEPWVSPIDVAEAITAEMEKPFAGRTVHYVASDEVAPNEVARILEEAMGIPDLKWVVVTDEEFQSSLIAAGLNAQVANGLTEMNASRINGILYDDYIRNRPVFGRIKLTEFAKDFARVYKHI